MVVFGVIINNLCIYLILFVDF